MIPLFCAYALIIGYVSVRARDPHAGGMRLYTFIVDPLTMFLVGFVTVLVTFRRGKGKPRLGWERYLRRKRILNVLFTVFLTVFWTLEILTYFNVLPYPFDPSRTGNDFMWNGYLDLFIGRIVDTTVPTYKSVGMNILALFLLILQFAMLRIGRWFGHMTSYFNDLDNWTTPSRR